MPVRRVNSTGRKPIKRHDVAFSLARDPDGVFAYEARFDLAGYEFPADASIHVEVYRSTTFMRFDHGTIGSPLSPPKTERRLTEFSTPEGLLFRVKVTSAGYRPGLLLAEIDRVPAIDDEEQPDDRMALLPPRPADLGQEVWRVEISEGQGPQLLLNKELADWKTTASSSEFRSIVFPAALRQVLWHVVMIRRVHDADDPDDWGSRWLEFARSLPGVSSLPAGPAGAPDDVASEWGGWIDSAVEAFCGQHRALQQYKLLQAAEGRT